MLGNRKENSIDNSGYNAGVIVADNTGTINISIENGKPAYSLIANLVRELGVRCPDSEDNNENYIPYKINDKITYNCVIKYRDIIKEYYKYGSTCEEYFNILDNSSIGTKVKILRHIRYLYIDCKGSILLEYKDKKLDEMDIIRENADRLIDMVKNQIQLLINDSKLYLETNAEEISFGLTIIVCYCFVECKILEKPI